MSESRYVMIKNRKKTELLINFIVGGQVMTLTLPPKGSIIVKEDSITETIRFQEKQKDLVVRHYNGTV